MGLSRVTGKRASVVGCLLLDADSPGFAIPIVADPDRPGRWTIQEVDEVANSVVGLTPIDDDNADIIPIQNGPEITIGGDIVFAFVENRSKIYSGTLKDLRDRLRALAIAFRQWPGIILQIAELIGSKEEKKAARAEMRRLIGKRSGESAATAFYDRSALRIALWDKVLAHAVDAKAAKKILNARKFMDVHINADGIVTVDLKAISSEDYSGIDAQTLAQELSAEFDLNRPTDESEVIQSENLGDTNVSAKVGAALTRILSAGRQEARIAIILSEIARDPTIAKELMSRYQHDRAKFATLALRIIRQSLGDIYQPPQSQLVISHIIEVLYREVFPTSRGFLLYCFSKELADFPNINRIIGRLAAKSHSIFMEEYRARIDENLKRAEMAMTNSISN
jgi:hypothetical protein